MTNDSSDNRPAPPDDDAVRNRYLGVGIALGLGIGTALSVATNNWGLLGAGMAIGVALGVALGAMKSGPGAASPSSEREPHEPTR